MHAEVSRIAVRLKIDLNQRVAPYRSVGVLAEPGEDKPVRFIDHLIFSADPVILAFGRPHANAILAADAKIYFARRHREPIRAPPVSEVLWLGPNLEHQIARSAKFALQKELVRRITSYCCFVHVRLLGRFFTVVADHPLYAEFIGKASPIGSPRHIGHRHFDLAAVR
jgi:hypothetical protein